MPPKRKAPLAASDSNVIVAPAAKKVATGTNMAQAGPHAAAAVKKYKYSDPSSVTDQGPVECTFFMWPSTNDDEDDEEEDDDDDDDDDEEEDITPGSLQEVLNGLENEKAKAVHEALNPPRDHAQGPRALTVGEGRQIIDVASDPYKKKMDEARQKFVTAGTLTADEAKSIVGQDDETRKSKRKAKRDLQKALNGLQKERNAAVHLALGHDGSHVMTVEEKQRRTAEASKPFEEKMDGVRGVFERYKMLTADEIKAISPNIGDGVDDDKNNQEGGENTDKTAEKEKSVSPRVVTDEGFPLTKAGTDKFFEINKEVDNRDPDMHDMYIFNDYAGYGVVEVLENMFNKIIFKKDVSPLKKWAVVEGLTAYLGLGEHMSLLMNENSEGNGEVFKMMGIMFVTALEMLHESALIGPASPLPDNIGLMTLFFIDFMANTATDFELEWVHEIVRAADAYGVVLNPLEQVEHVDQETLEEFRDMCDVEKKTKGFTWKGEYPKFKKEHPGGHHYDITKMPKREMSQYKFSSRRSDAGSWETLSGDSDEMDSDLDSYEDMDEE